MLLDRRDALKRVFFSQAYEGHCTIQAARGEVADFGGIGRGNWKAWGSQILGAHGDAGAGAHSNGLADKLNNITPRPCHLGDGRCYMAATGTG